MVFAYVWQIERIGRGDASRKSRLALVWALLSIALIGAGRLRAQQVDSTRPLTTVPQVSLPPLVQVATEESDVLGDWDLGLLLEPIGWDSVQQDAADAALSVGDAGTEDEDAGAGTARGRESSDRGDGAGPLRLSGTLGGGRSAYSMGALQLLRVRPGGFGIESFSVVQGGVLSERVAVSPTAVGQLRGSVAWLSEESALAATNPYSVATTYSNGVVTSVAVKPRGAMNQVGMSVGLPLRMPGTFFKQRAVALSGVMDVQLHQDNLVSSPVHPDFFALTAEQVALLGTRGVSAAATNTALNYLSSLTGTTSRTAWRVAAGGRVGVALSKRDELVLGYSADYVDAPAGAALGQASDAVVARGRGSLGDSHVHLESGTVQWQRSLSKRWTNDLRVELVHDLEYESARASLPQEPLIGPGGLAPQVSIAPEGFAYGTPANLGRRAYPDEQRIAVADTMRLQLGRHVLTVGGEWRRVDDHIASVANEEGSFLYDSGIVNGHDGGLVDWVTDYTFNVHAYPNGACPSINAAVHDFCFRTYTQGFGTESTEFAMHDLAGFAEDAMRLRKDLMVTAGIRYDYTLLPLPQRPNGVLDADLAAVGIAAATSRFPEDRNNFGPRFAATYAPRWSHGVTALAGYGVFYGRVPGGTVRAALQDTALPSSSLHVRITPTTEVQCPQVTGGNQGFGYPCAFAAGTPPGVVAQTTSATLFAPSFRAPMVQRGTLMLEGAFAKGLHVRLGYEMAYAKQLPASTDVNIAASKSVEQYVLQGGDAYPGLHSGETFAVPLYTQRLVSQYGAVTAVESNANAYYNAGTLEAEWHGARGFAVRGSYTFSRGIDDGPQQSATPSLSSQFDPFANGYDKGLSSLQFPQRFAGSLQWESQWKRGSKTERRVLSGWRVAALGTAGSGAPYSYTLFAGTRLPGGHESINGSGGATYLPTVGRNTLRLPPRGKLDLRVGREFAASSRVRIGAFAEAFNLLNERNVTGVETRAFVAGGAATIGGGSANGPSVLVFQNAAAIASEGLATPAFGTPNSSTAGSSKERRVEFGLRASF